jgi:hypothetical protein
MLPFSEAVALGPRVRTCVCMCRAAPALRCVSCRRQLAVKLSEFPERFLLPLSARMSCSGLMVDKCRVMDSKQVGWGGGGHGALPWLVCSAVAALVLGACVVTSVVLCCCQAPLWLEFTNADPLGGRIKIIYKAGDDLRQDKMTLNMIHAVTEVR